MKRIGIAFLLLILVATTILSCQAAETPKPVFQPLKVLYPNGGENLTSGSGITISWMHSTETIGKTVKLNIRLLGDDGVGSYTKIVQNIETDRSVGVSVAGPSGGGWAWTIPQNLSPGKYVIQVDEVAENGVHYLDTSNNYFSITTLPERTSQSITMRLSPNTPAAIRPGIQVPLLRFEVTAASEGYTLKEVYFSFFYDAGGAEASAKNFTLWNGPVLISRDENLNPQTVKFLQSPLMVVANSTVNLEIRGDIIGPDGAGMEIILSDQDVRSPVPHIKTFLKVLRP